jgi:hypothetical protein
MGFRSCQFKDWLDPRAARPTSVSAERTLRFAKEMLGADKGNRFFARRPMFGEVARGLFPRVTSQLRSCKAPVIQLR